MRPIQLGDQARDRISGFEGIVVAITDWLAGCRRITIEPPLLHDGKPIGSQTFDAALVELIQPDAIVLFRPEAIDTRTAADAPVEAPAPKIGGPSIAPTRAEDPR